MDLSPGGKHLRVWQLGFRTDFGLAGMADPFDMVNLIELVLAHGLLGRGFSVIVLKVVEAPQPRCHEASDLEFVS